MAEDDVKQAELVRRYLSARLTPSSSRTTVHRSGRGTPAPADPAAGLLEQAFAFDHHALDRTVDVHVMNLRRKIEADPPRRRTC